MLPTSDCWAGYSWRWRRFCWPLSGWSSPSGRRSPPRCGILFFRIPLAPWRRPGGAGSPPQEAPCAWKGEPSKGPEPGEEAPRHACAGRACRGFLQTLQELAQAVGKASQEPAEKAPPEPVRPVHLPGRGGGRRPRGHLVRPGVQRGLLRLRGCCLGCCPAGARRSPWTWITSSREHRVDFSARGVHPGVVFIGRRAYTTV